MVASISEVGAYVDLGCELLGRLNRKERGNERTGAGYTAQSLRRNWASPAICRVASPRKDAKLGTLSVKQSKVAGVLWEKTLGKIDDKH